MPQIVRFALSDRRTPRAFTLVEMLVVIGIITLLAGLITASVMGAKRSANSAMGELNMKSCGDVLLSDAFANKGDFYNPFVPGGDQGALTEHPDGYKFQFAYADHSRYTADSFAAYWYSYMSIMRPGQGLAMEAFFSPADGEAVSQYRKVTDSSGAALVPGSFYLSPTFYRAQSMYDFTTLPPGCCASEFGNIYRGDCCYNCKQTSCQQFERANVERVAFPAAKVMLFERADFEQKQRTQIRDGVATVRRLPPAWNNPRARPRVMTVDGAITRADMRSLTARAAEGVISDPALSYVPVDMLAVPDLMPLSLGNHNECDNAATISVGDGGELYLDAPAPTDGLYPMFFAATRGGIRGRDLPNR